ncbi:MAG: hypothetical protein ACRDD8_15555, partial [Bacteroidales bacterium]
MVERIICRFRNEEDLQEFATRNGFDLCSSTKEYDIHTKQSKLKKKGKKKEVKEMWRNHWKEMPEFIYEDVEPHAKIEFIFKKED